MPEYDDYEDDFDASLAKEMGRPVPEKKSKPRAVGGGGGRAPAGRSAPSAAASAGDAEREKRLAAQVAALRKQNETLKKELAATEGTDRLSELKVRRDGGTARLGLCAC